jgi:hypothetical protein
VVYWLLRDLVSCEAPYALCLCGVGSDRIAALAGVYTTHPCRLTRTATEFYTYLGDCLVGHPDERLELVITAADNRAGRSLFKRISHFSFKSANVPAVRFEDRYAAYAATRVSW